MFSFCWSTIGTTQTIRTNLLKDFRSKGKVMEITFTPEYEGLPFTIATYKAPKNITFKFFLQEKEHIVMNLEI